MSIARSREVDDVLGTHRARPETGQDLAMGERSPQRLRQTPGGHPLTSRVSTPDPKADLQGVTSELE